MQPDISLRERLFTFAVCALIIALPWAVGLNRPWAWGGFCVATFGLVCLRLGLYKRHVRSPVFTLPLVSFMLFMAWAVIQLVPGLSSLSVWPMAEAALNTLGSVAQEPAWVSQSISLNLQPQLLLLLSAFAACLWLGLQVPKPRWVGVATLSAVSASAALACWALMFPQETWWGITRLDYLNDATLPFLNRNAMASYVTIGLLLAASYAPRFMQLPRTGQKAHIYMSDHLPTTLAYGALLAFLALTLLLTHSRAGVATALLGLIILWIVRGWKHRKVLLLTIVSVVVLAALMPILSDRLSLFPEDFARRVNIWQASWQVAQYCFPHGCGLGSFTEAYRLLGDATGSYRTIDKAHNVVLHTLVTMGWAALLLPLMIFPLLWRVWRNKVYSAGRLPPLEGATLAAWVAVLVHNMVDFSLHMPAILATLLFLLGASLRGQLNHQAHGRMHKKEATA